MKIYFESQHIGQIYRRIDSGEQFAIIGSMDGKNISTSKLNELEKKVAELAIDKGVTYQYTTGRYTMKNGEIIDEPGYILYHITKEDASSDRPDRERFPSALALWLLQTAVYRGIPGRCPP